MAFKTTNFPKHKFVYKHTFSILFTNICILSVAVPCISHAALFNGFYDNLDADMIGYKLRNFIVHFIVYFTVANARADQHVFKFFIMFLFKRLSSNFASVIKRVEAN